VEAFTFYRPRCDAVVRRVLDHIARTTRHPNT
jgi:hypothetical protein